jgi:hypothetical protein
MPEEKKKPVNVFVSYSHEDAKFQSAFHKAVSVLRRRGLIGEWFDGQIVPGEDFGKEIFRQLARAEIVVLLLSPSYVNSEFCWGKELKAALEHRQHRDLRVVGILVRPVHLEGTELSQHKLLPKDRKPVTKWHLQDEAWESVCVGLEQVIMDLRHPSQVDDALGAAKAVFETASALQTGSGRAASDAALSLPSVGEFWARRGTEVTPHRTISLEGTFSQFAPMLGGAPTAKRHLHKAFRQLLQSDEKLRRRKAPSLDACLSVSAGQMVWRFRNPDAVHACYGLYNSIVRNSISVLVTGDYQRHRLEPLFAEHGRKTFEARVTGRVIPLDNSPVRQFLQKHAGDFMPESIVDELCREAYGLLVDGNGTGVDRIGGARYLDGDIWLAVDSGGRERFLTAFLDVANPREREQELNELFNQAKALAGPPRVFAQYDDEREFTQQPGKLSESNQFLDSIWRFGFGA